MQSHGVRVGSLYETFIHYKAQARNNTKLSLFIIMEDYFSNTKFHEPAWNAGPGPVA